MAFTLFISFKLYTVFCSRFLNKIHTCFWYSKMIYFLRSGTSKMLFTSILFYCLTMFILFTSRVRTDEPDKRKIDSKLNKKIIAYKITERSVSTHKSLVLFPATDIRNGKWFNYLLAFSCLQIILIVETNSVCQRLVKMSHKFWDLRSTGFTWSPFWCSSLINPVLDLFNT